MKKLIASLFALAALCTAVAAQEKVTTVQDVTESSDANGKVVTTTTYDVHSVRTNRFWDNWSLGIGIGAQMYLGENDQYLKPGDWISPAFNIEVAKWLTPEFGIKLGVDFAQMKGLWQHYHPYLGPEYKEDWGKVKILRNLPGGTVGRWDIATATGKDYYLDSSLCISKPGKEYVKVAYCPPAYLTYMQSTS